MRCRGLQAGFLLATSSIAWASASGASEIIVYSYDSLGRLVRVEHGGTVNSGVIAHYGYDPADNRTNVSVGGAGAAPPTAAPAFSVTDASATEGGSLAFTVIKTGSASATFSIAYATADGSAGAGGDYGAASGTLTFAPAETSKTVAIATIDDSLDENSETLSLNLSGATGGASVTDPQGIGTILDNDDPPPAALPAFSVGDASVAEGGALVFTVSRSGTATGSYSVGYATSDGSAASHGDYHPAAGTLTFAPAEAARTVTVATVDDSLDENGETLSLNLSGATGGAAIADPQGIGTILDNDDPPPSNHPPTAMADSGAQATCTSAAYDVLANDSDIDGDTPLSLVSVEGSGFSVASETEVQFVSTASTGDRIGTYVVRDSRGATASGTLSVAVAGPPCMEGPLSSPTRVRKPAPPAPSGGDGS